MRPFFKNLSVFSFFLLFLVLLYGETLYDLPRSDHALLFTIYERLSWDTEGLKNAISVAFFGDRRFQPLAFPLHFLQIRAFWDNIFLYHIVNLALHAVNGFFLFKCLNHFYKNQLLSFLNASVFLFAFTHVDFLSWPFHFYSLLQVSLVLAALLLLIKGGGRKGYLRTAYGLTLVQAYLYEPGVVFPLFLLAADLYIHRAGMRKILKERLILITCVYSVYLITLALFWGLFTEVPLSGPGEEKELLSLSNMGRALVGTLFLHFDTALMHNLITKPLVRIDELVFFLPYLHPGLILKFPRAWFKEALPFYIFVASLVLSAVLLLLGRKERPRGIGLLLVISASLLFTFVILLGRPVVYAVSQSRYAYIPAMALSVVIPYPFLRKGKGPVVLLAAGVLVAVTLINVRKVKETVDEIMAYRYHTNSVYYTAVDFVTDHANRDKTLFIGVSSYPPHERLAWGSDVITMMLLKDRPGITYDYAKATHMMVSPRSIKPIKEKKDDGDFAISFGLWIGAGSEQTPIEVFGGKDGGYFLTVEPDGDRLLGKDLFGLASIVFGRIEGGDKRVIYRTGTFLLKEEEMNAISFGRAKGHYFVIFNGRLREKRYDEEGEDIKDIDLEIGPLYRMEYLQPIYGARASLMKGYVPWPVAESPVGHRFGEIPYLRRAFREYARTLHD